MLVCLFVIVVFFLISVFVSGMISRRNGHWFPACNAGVMDETCKT